MSSKEFCMTIRANIRHFSKGRKEVIGRMVEKKLNISLRQIAYILDLRNVTLEWGQI